MRNEDVRDLASPDPVVHHLNLCPLSAVNQKKLSIHRYYLAGRVTVKCRDGRVTSKDSYGEHERIYDFGPDSYRDWNLKALNLATAMQGCLNKNYVYDLSVLSISPR
jgi:hypothetical protein